MHPMTESEAIAIAKVEVAKNDWSWFEPVRASQRSTLFRGKRWKIVSNFGNRGCNVRVVIDDQDGSIIQAGYCPR
jgi:hypothetical protein